MEFHTIQHSVIEEISGDENTAKIIAMILLFIFSFFFGSLPIKLCEMVGNKTRSYNIKMKLFLGFGAGVLMHIIFYKLLPDVNAGFQKTKNSGRTSRSAELIMCVGFFFVYLVKECANFHYLKKQDRVISKSSTTTTIATICNSDHLGNVNNCDQALDVSRTDIVFPLHEKSLFNSERLSPKPLGCLLILLALTIHGLFEGISIGIACSAKEVWYSLTVVSSDKFIIAFCLGMEIVASRTKTSMAIVYIFIYAALSSLGIGMGAFVNNFSMKCSEMITLVLQGFAAGALLFVVFFEILLDETRRGFGQYFAVLGGFTTMLLISCVN